VAEYWNQYGTAIDFDIPIQYIHIIHVSTNPSQVVSQRASTNYGQAYSLLVLTNSLGNCYRARLDATAITSGYSSQSGTWYSAFEVCNLQEDPPDDGDTQCYEYCSPILLDLDGNGFHLTGVDDPVSFDIDGDGLPERLAWTSATTADAFLALDRNGNGRIDSGRELFGNRTLTESGASAGNGYEALFEFDLPSQGGDGNGLIDSEDEAFRNLLLWIDRNHNGTTDGGELSSLGDAGVLSLECGYRASGRRDEHGNYFRYRGKAWMENPAGIPRPVATYDIFFRLVER
jgi:hypothetical protein